MPTHRSGFFNQPRHSPRASHHWPRRVIPAALCAILFLPATPWAGSVEYFVSPKGSAAGPGTRTRPFATLNQALDETRKAPKGTQKRILLLGGNYYNVHLDLEPADSGLYLTAAPTQTPVLYGGQYLTNWRKEGESLFVTDLPTFPLLPGQETHPEEAGDWVIRMLEVDGQWCPQARMPETGTYEHVTTFDVPWMSTTGGGWKRQPTPEELTTLQFQDNQPLARLEIKNAEITVYHMWDESRVGVVSVDAERRRLQLSPPAGHPPGAFGVKKFVIWNVAEGLTKPGQWYHDRAHNRLVYWPLPGQDMTKAHVVAPTRHSIIRLAGTPTNKVKNVTLKGLTLAVNSVPLITGGFAASAYDGAISLSQTEQCSLLNLNVLRVAGHAINGRTADRATRIQNCVIHDCGAGGVYVGGTNCVIYDNLIQGIGKSFPSAVGIYRGGRQNQVAHNEIHDCSYSAINYGGEGNIIENNLIYDCMKELHDGAAIYMFAARNCVLRRNLARDIVDTGGYGASAYYLDERSQGCVVEENATWNVSWPSHNHMATNSLLRNNFFIVQGDAKWTFPRCAGFAVERNILFATGTVRIENPGAVTNWSNNIIYSQSGKIESVALSQYRAGRIQRGAPAGTTAADPLFKDPTQPRFDLQPDSPAFKMGIRALPKLTAGRRTK